jgi:hypothetical protein
MHANYLGGKEMVVLFFALVGFGGVLGWFRLFVDFVGGAGWDRE